MSVGWSLYQSCSCLAPEPVLLTPSRAAERGGTLGDQCHLPLAPHPEGMQSFFVEWITKPKPFHAAEKDKQKNLTHKTREKLIWVDQMYRVDNALRVNFVLGSGNYFSFSTCKHRKCASFHPNLTEIHRSLGPWLWMPVWLAGASDSGRLGVGCLKYVSLQFF